VTPRGNIRSLRGLRYEWVLAAILLVGGGMLLGLGFRGSDHALTGPVPSPAAVRAAVPSPTTPQALATARSVPVNLAIPAIGMSVSLGSLGLNPDGTVQVPNNTVQPGWFRLGPAPGQIGSSVILGHVDSYLGPGVFFQLRTLAAGDRVDVGLADGATVQFTVNAVAEYSKTDFPSQRVYGSHGSSDLQLVTCGGVFDQHTGSYLSNIVVYSSLTAVLPAPPALPSAPPPRW